MNGRFKTTGVKNSTHIQNGKAQATNRLGDISPGYILRSKAARRGVHLTGFSWKTSLIKFESVIVCLGENHQSSGKSKVRERKRVLDLAHPTLSVSARAVGLGQSMHGRA
jgi:hypothetical protein